MQPSTVVAPPRVWARDFAIVGAATGFLAPFLVIFDPVFATAGGLAGAGSGLVLGAVLSVGVEQIRHRVPLTVLVASACLIGALWGAATGAVAGGVSSVFGGTFTDGVVALGFMFGGLSGMLQMGWMFLPYLVGSVHRNTLPVVGLALVAAPFMGWLGLAALIGSGLGLWMFALPPLVIAAVLLEGNVRKARELQAPVDLEPMARRAVPVRLQVEGTA